MSPHPEWLVATGLPAGIGGLMTTRQGGCSASPFDALNLQFDNGDLTSRVVGNRATLAAAIGAAPVFLQQVHGSRVVRLREGHLTAPPESADASVTTEPGLACTVLVADCLPVLFAAPGVVGAAHAGWRGLAGGVLEATLEAVCEAGGCRPADVSAWLGASIGPRRFQVGRDVLDAFAGDCVGRGLQAADADAPAPEVAGFVPEQPGKWLADLPWLARQRLAAQGLTRIAGGAGCTVSDASRFFSFRRDRVTGRMAAVVWIHRRGSAGP